jgi:hypothetical protein
LTHLHHLQLPLKPLKPLEKTPNPSENPTNVKKKLQSQTINPQPPTPTPNPNQGGDSIEHQREDSGKIEET